MVIENIINEILDIVELSNKTLYHKYQYSHEAIQANIKIAKLKRELENIDKKEIIYIYDCMRLNIKLNLENINMNYESKNLLTNCSLHYTINIYENIIFKIRMLNIASYIFFILYFVNLISTNNFIIILLFIIIDKIKPVYGLDSCVFDLNYNFKNIIYIWIIINIILFIYAIICFFIKVFSNWNATLANKFTIINDRTYKHLEEHDGSLSINYNEYNNFNSYIVTYYNNSIHKKIESIKECYEFNKSNILCTRHIGLLLINRQNNNDVYLYDLTKFGIKLTRIEEVANFRCKYESILDPFIGNINFVNIEKQRIENIQFNSCYSFIYSLFLLYPNNNNINLLKLLFPTLFLYNKIDIKYVKNREW